MIKKLLLVALVLCVIFGQFNMSVSEIENVMSTPLPVVSTPSLTPTPTPNPTPTPTPKPEVFTISMVGDCTLASSQYFPDFEGIIGNDMAYPFRNTVEFLENDYLSIANMESSLSDTPLYSGSLFHFLGATAHAEIFRHGNIELVTLANNHCMDFGEDGIMSTISALDEFEIDYVKPSSSFIYQRDDGLKIGLYAAAWLASDEEILSGIAELCETSDLDLVISLMHWGAEGSYRANSDQIRLGQAMIDAGVDIVYGSHPHVLQSIDSYGDGYIVNSLGNYVFGGNTNPDDKDSVIVQFDITRDYDGNISISPWSAIPCSVSSVEHKNDYCPTPYEINSEQYERAMSKLLGTYSGDNLSLSYRNNIDGWE